MAPTEVMHCMEVWGGNEPVESAVGMPGLDAFVYSRPYEDPLEATQAKLSGGDVHYVSSCATGRIVRLLLADVSGHGPAVSAVARQLRSLMREHVNHLDQVSFVRQMNRRFTELSDAGSFATAVVNTYFAPTRRLTLCNAGHPAPLLYRRKTGKWLLLQANEPAEEAVGASIRNLPLGIEGLGDYEQFSLRLDVGDIVLCYSDSLIESERIDDGLPQMIGQQGLLDLVASQLLPDPINTLIPRLLKLITNLMPQNLQKDDVTVLLFECNGSGQQTSWRRKLLSPFLVIKGITRAMRRREHLPLPDFRLANIGGLIMKRMERSGE